MAHVPANPDYAAAVAASFASQGLMATLGARLAAVAPGMVAIEVPFSPAVSQQHGHFHGAVIGAIGDNAGGYAALSLMPAGSEVLTVEYKINFMRPATGTLLRATGHVVRAGRTITVTRMEVASGSGGDLQPCAVLLATMMRVVPAVGASG